MVQNIYGVTPLPPEEYHEAIDNLNDITQGLQTHSNNLEGLSQANTRLTISNSAVMAQLAQMTVTMNIMQAKIKILLSAPTK